MKPVILRRLRLPDRPAGAGMGRWASEKGQSLVEMLMVLGLLVAMAIFINAGLSPVVLDAFQSIGRSLSSVGP